MHASFPASSPDTRRIWPVASVALALFALISASPAWSLSDAPYEGADGNLQSQLLPDWETIAGTPALHVGLDTPSGQTDDALNVKEDDAVPGLDFGSIPSNKSDLLRVYLTHQRIGEVGATRDF